MEVGVCVAINFNSNKVVVIDVINSFIGEGYFVVWANISYLEVVECMVEVVVGEMGGIDILVNNVGVFIFYLIVEVSY